MSKQQSNFDLLAFCIVELGISYPYDQFAELTTDDPLYRALVEKWREKQEREHTRFAMLASMLAKMMGNKNAKMSDFMPKKKLSREDEAKKQKQQLELLMLKQEALGKK